MDDGQCLHTITDHCGSVKVCIARLERSQGYTTVQLNLSAHFTTVNWSP